MSVTILWIPHAARPPRTPARSLSELTNLVYQQPLDRAQVHLARRVVAAIGAPLAIGGGDVHRRRTGRYSGPALWNACRCSPTGLPDVGHGQRGGDGAVFSALMRSHHLHSRRHSGQLRRAMLIVLEIFMIIPFFLRKRLTWARPAA
ncbi:MAG: hypothetical protein U0401_14705 [Anaerolineae bacterium]